MKEINQDTEHPNEPDQKPVRLTKAQKKYVQG